MLTNFCLFILADAILQFLRDAGEVVAFLQSEEDNPE